MRCYMDSMHECSAAALKKCPLNLPPYRNVCVRDVVQQVEYGKHHQVLYWRLHLTLKLVVSPSLPDIEHVSYIRFFFTFNETCYIFFCHFLLKHTNTHQTELCLRLTFAIHIT